MDVSEPNATAHGDFRAETKPIVINYMQKNLKKIGTLVTRHHFYIFQHLVQYGTYHNG